MGTTLLHHLPGYEIIYICEQIYMQIYINTVYVRAAYTTIVIQYQILYFLIKRGSKQKN